VGLVGMAVNMRRSYDGPCAIARAGFAGDPICGDLYVFVNHRGSQIKVPYFDRSGLHTVGETVLTRLSAAAR
jgi:transposase